MKKTVIEMTGEKRQKREKQERKKLMGEGNEKHESF